MDPEDPKLTNAFVKLHNILKDSKAMGIREKHNPKKLSLDEELVPTPSFKENYQTKRKIEPEGLSRYELERLDNIRQNQEFLSSIKLLEAKEDLKRETNTLIKKDRKVQWTEILPPRTKSLRIQKFESEKPPLESHTTYYKPKHVQKRCKPRKPQGPIRMEALNMEDSRLPRELLKLWKEDSVEKEDEEEDEDEEEMVLSEYRSNLKDMELSEFGGAAKVMNDCIFSAAFHPCSSRLLMAAGDNSGEVGLWIPDSDMGDNSVLQFEPHTKPVVCMAFSRSHPTDLLTLSCDGTIRSTNVKKAVFDEVYRIKHGLKTFDFLSHDCSTLVAGDWNGDVAVIDRRTPGTSHESLHSLDSNMVCCVHVHPVHKQYIVVAQNSVVSIYDVRCMKESSNEPVSQLLGHSDSISGAYFSPGTGNRVLTSCLDDSIRIYDTSEITHKAPLLTRIKHDMETQPWMSDLAAVWDPKKEDCFVVGSIQQPRRMQVFHEGGQLQHSFQHPKITKVLSVTAFHPIRNALLGCNARGKMYVFTD